MLLLCIFLLGLRSSAALNNGLALTPPMGWLSWERFRCNIDCENDPENCIGERLYMETADRMAEDGYRDLGYDYVILDDCWLDKQRDAQGKLQPDKTRFPHGIKSLADYVHSKGLKFGIYEDYGNLTCAGYPGIIGHMETDANTFAEWGVDYVKLDGCYADPKTMDAGYPEMGNYLNKTGRPMVYSCSWPDYQISSGMKPNYSLIAEHCNLWRNFDDIDDSWTSVQSIINYYSVNQDQLIPHAGPGQWNDPDMLIIGNFGLSFDQAKAQMALWAIMASPLIMSVDLRTITDQFKNILQNKQLIAVNQCSLGIQGRLVLKKQNIEVWVKPINPSVDDNRSNAIAVLSHRVDGMPYKITINLKTIGLNYPDGYHVYDLFSGKDHGFLKPSSNITLQVNPTGVVMLRADIIQKYFPEVNLL